MKHKRYFEFVDECWKVPVLIVWDIYEDGFTEFIEHKYGYDVAGEHTGTGLYIRVPTDDVDVAVIAMTEVFTGTPVHYGILAHECFHAAFDILKDRGVKYTRSSEEAFTYFADSLVERLATGMLAKESKIK